LKKGAEEGQEEGKITLLSLPNCNKDCGGKIGGEGESQ